MFFIHSLHPFCHSRLQSKLFFSKVNHLLVCSHFLFQLVLFVDSVNLCSRTFTPSTSVWWISLTGGLATGWCGLATGWCKWVWLLAGTDWLLAGRSVWLQASRSVWLPSGSLDWLQDIPLSVGCSLTLAAAASWWFRLPNHSCLLADCSFSVLSDAQLPPSQSQWFPDQYPSVQLLDCRPIFSRISRNIIDTQPYRAHSFPSLQPAATKIVMTLNLNYTGTEWIEYTFWNWDLIAFNLDVTISFVISS